MTMKADPDKIITVTRQCSECGKVGEIQIKFKDHARWFMGNESIQDVFPYLTVAERGLLNFGGCGDCFDELTAIWNKEEEEREEGNNDSGSVRG